MARTPYFKKQESTARVWICRHSQPIRIGLLILLFSTTSNASAAEFAAREISSLDPIAAIQFPYENIHTNIVSKRVSLRSANEFDVRIGKRDTNTRFATQTNVWKKLEGKALEEALLNRVLIYPDEGGAVQEFNLGGATVYIENGPSFGRWRTSDSHYCSVWPPATHWVCYELEQHSDGKQVRFISESGRVYLGKYREK